MVGEGRPTRWPGGSTGVLGVRHGASRARPHTWTAILTQCAQRRLRCSHWLRMFAAVGGCSPLPARRSVARSGFTPPRPRVGVPELRSPRVDVWDEAVQFLLIGDRARQLAERHPLTADG